MSNFDLFDEYEPEQPATLEEEKPPRPPRPRRRLTGYDLFTAVILFATVLFVVWAVLLVMNPFVPYNPFPPQLPGPTPTIFLLDSGEQAAVVPPTWTPSPSITPGPTATRPATATPTNTPQATATGVTPPPGATNTVAVFPFTLQNEAVTYVAYEGEEGCEWSSIAGQVFDLDGDPVPGLPVQVTGDEGFSQLVFTGPDAGRGPSGYEVPVGEEPAEAEFVVRLLNTTGMPLSEPIVVRTLSSCDRNVAIVNFVQNHEFSR